MKNESESKSSSDAEALGLSEQSKFDAGKSPRNETNEETQRPVSTTEKISTERGKFTMK